MSFIGYGLESWLLPENFIRGSPPSLKLFFSLFYEEGGGGGGVGGSK